MNSGIPINSAVDLPLVGRLGFLVSLKDELGEPIVLSNDRVVRAFALENPGDAEVDAIFDKSSDDAEVIVTAEDGVIFIILTQPDRDLFLTNQLYQLVVETIDAGDDSILSVNTFSLIPVNHCVATFSSMSAFLSTRFTNTLDLLGTVGGVGYLDSRVTVGQPVGCVVSFVVDGVKSEYVLEVYTDQAGAGFVTPDDFNASTNAKIWRKI